jgi:hypothetical protein
MEGNVAKDAKDKTEDEWREWMRAHHVRYQVLPLEAVSAGQVIQVGFEVEIAAEVPIAGQPVALRRQVARDVQLELIRLAHHVFPAEGEVARAEVGPFRALVQVGARASKTEVRCTVTISRKKNPSQEVAPGDRQRLAPFEQRLKSLGVKARV